MKLVLFGSLLGFVINLSGQNIRMNELDPLTGEKWTGMLTYVDYSTNKKEIVPVELKVIKLDKSIYQFAYSYPDNPESNSKSKIKIGFEGSSIAGSKIIEVQREIDGTVSIVANSKGKDNKKKAVLEFDYTFAPNQLIIRKRVKYEGTDEFFIRNSYRLRR